MDLISNTYLEGRIGPTHPVVYPPLPGVDLADARTFTGGQPFDAYARLRRDAPVMWHPEPRGGPGFWVVSRHADVMTVDADPLTFSSQRGGILMGYGEPGGRHGQLHRASLDAMINLDGPPHMALRREHMPYFTPAYLRGLTDRVSAEVTRLLNDMAKKGRCDLVSNFSAQLPLYTLCEILGVPEADRPKFLGWMHFLELAQNIAGEQSGEASFDPDNLPPEVQAFIDAFNANVSEMFEYGRVMLHKRRLDPQPDLMSAIARAQVDGELLSDEFLDGSWLLIVFAGNDTTRNTLSGAMKLLTEFPDQKARLIADPSLLPNAANEFIRMVSPVIYMRRTATRDVELAGQTIAEGEKVIMYYGAANRDDAVFADPDRLDVGRANADKHIAFGYGPHVCIGKRVAQIQLEEAYRQILARFPDIRWTGEIDIAPNNFVHAIRQLGVEFTPER
ncbi:cytochrome P450 [Phenylobacterium sp. LH3H17]|uniref:cytochrome P450 n=1 Tax=Phenylobacterium sp. LH3H17 TaxID=2903901 RepID=UPI0020C9F235|nr:cytochrome P450 [Phenylobacterium sp. LH3H17]UTP41421.1 cytochrome P450 [Phenylobacterium sp. LH3H17]